MGQLFLNPIANAIKFRKDNQQQQITITQSRKEEISAYGHTSRWQVITISDTGVGFDASMSQAIFEVFKRAHSQAQFKGTGVGLSICRKIMENHGGRIIASSVEGKGASFALYFPVKEG